MAESSSRLSLAFGLRVAAYITRPRFLVAFLYFGSALLFETTTIENSNIAKQFRHAGHIDAVAHTMAMYFLLIGNLAIAPMLFRRFPDLLRHWYGIGLILTPIAFYAGFGVLAAFDQRTLLPVWWTAWVLFLMGDLLVRGRR